VIHGCDFLSIWNFYMQALKKLAIFMQVNVYQRVE